MRYNSSRFIRTIDDSKFNFGECFLICLGKRINRAEDYCPKQINEEIDIVKYR